MTRTVGHGPSRSFRDFISSMISRSLCTRISFWAVHVPLPCLMSVARSCANRAISCLSSLRRSWMCMDMGDGLSRRRYCRH